MNLTINPDTFFHFTRFAIEHKESGDIDPVYPVLQYVVKSRYDITTGERAIWHTLLYLTWYHLGSAETVLQRFPEVGRMEEWPFHTALPTGVERRGFRGTAGCVKALEMVNWMVENRTPLNQWLGDVTREGGENGWMALYQDMLTTPHNGTWAAFKWCDLVKNVLCYPITSPDIGVGGKGENAGPVPGLVTLTGRSWDECAYDYNLQHDFYAYCIHNQIPWDGLEEMETALCDFNSVAHQRYYVGHDIDKQQSDIMGCPRIYWEARKHVFPRSYLGELNGWDGVRKQLKGTIRGRKLELGQPLAACPVAGGVAQ
jgi:hypothetical protein